MVESLDEMLEDYLIGIEKPFESTHPGYSWASEAEKCSRSVGYRIAGEPVTNKLRLYSRWNFLQGNHLHEVIQKAAAKRYGRDIEFEVGWEMENISGRADAVTASSVWEIKTINVFGFKRAVYPARGRPASGPESSAIMQGFLAASALGKQTVKIILATKEPSKAKETVTAAWDFEWTDARRREVDAEVKRLQSIANLVRAGDLPKPVLHDGRLITDPASVNFPCGYCAYKEACISRGAS